MRTLLLFSSFFPASQALEVGEKGQGTRVGGCCTALPGSISLPFKLLDPVLGNLWLVWLGHYTLQPMARTNHKFSQGMGPGNSKGSKIDICRNLGLLS